MTQEEKAKRYDEAIKKAESLYKASEPMSGCNVIIETIFPELKESEDEKMRKHIIEVLKDNFSGEDTDRCIAWLEKQGKQKSFDDIVKEVTKDKDAAISFLKSTGIMNENGELADEYKIEQGEQKPVDEVGNYDHEKVLQTIINEQKTSWNEEDETMVNSIISLCDFKVNIELHNEGVKEVSKKVLSWLNKLKDRVQPKQEWSEEDATHYNRILKELNLQKEMPINASVIEEVKSDIIWLKSLRLQNRLKPSGFHLECIEDAISLYEKRGINAIGLKEILDELKKLREE